jgi:diaminohydroxyphosphoribosylaminopyrimidine deaminase/5-amino-6-(5-phosphoribosylamino)uracil reductase
VPPEARLFGTCGDGPVIILASPEQIVSNPARVDALERAGATVVGSADLHDALTRLAERDVQSLLVEGGGRLHAALWDADLVDYLQLYIAPVWIGRGGVPAFGGRTVAAGALVDQHVELLGPDVLIEGYVHRPH